MNRKVSSIEHETDGYGLSQWWIYLHPGWIVSDEGTHSIVETRKRDALAKLSLVVPCACSECTEILAKNPHAVALGRKGGSVRSARKTAAVRLNGKLGGRPKKPPTT